MEVGGPLIIYSIIHRERERETETNTDTPRAKRRYDKSIKEDEQCHNAFFFYSMRIISNYISSLSTNIH